MGVFDVDCKATSRRALATRPDFFARFRDVTGFAAIGK
jgi:hypothetical protein